MSDLASSNGVAIVMVFCERIFQKGIRLDSGGPLLLRTISYHLNHQKYPFAGAQEPFQ